MMGFVKSLSHVKEGFKVTTEQRLYLLVRDFEYALELPRVYRLCSNFLFHPSQYKRLKFCMTFRCHYLCHIMIVFLSGQLVVLS